MRMLHLVLLLLLLPDLDAAGLLDLLLSMSNTTAGTGTGATGGWWDECLRVRLENDIQ